MHKQLPIGQSSRPRPSVDIKARTLKTKARPLDSKATKFVLGDLEDPRGQCLASITTTLSLSTSLSNHFSSFIYSFTFLSLLSNYQVCMLHLIVGTSCHLSFTLLCHSPHPPYMLLNVTFAASSLNLRLIYSNNPSQLLLVLVQYLWISTLNALHHFIRLSFVSFAIIAFLV